MRTNRAHTLLCLLALHAGCVLELRAKQSDVVRVQDSVVVTAAGALSAISAMAVASNGSMFVADNRSHMLRLYSRNGTEVASAPLPHEQAGTAVLVTAVAESHGALYVYDATSMKLHRYRVSGRNIEVNGAFATDVRGVDVCAMNGVVYILGFRNGAILHAVDAGGRVVRSFGQGIGSSDPIRSSIITAGSRVRCLPGSGLIAVIHNVSPLVRAFSTTGELRWSYTIPGFRPISIASAGGTAVRFTMPSTPVDAMVSLFSMSGGLAGIQVSRGSSAPGGGARSLETVVVRADVGSVVGQTQSLPSIADGAAGYMVRLRGGPEGPKLISLRYRIQDIGR